MIKLGLKGTLILFVCGVVFHWIFDMPLITSMNAATWHQYKFLKQEVNCIEDSQKRVMADLEAMMLDPTLRVDFNQSAEDLKTCARAIDPGKSSIEFIREELKR